MTRYQELAADLRRRIARGEFAVGAPLPSELRLADEYRASRGAIRNALQLLERGGMVESAPGSGWTVASALQTMEFRRARTFAEWAQAHGLEPGGRVVAASGGVPSAAEASALRIGAHEPVLRVTRLRLLDGRPVMLERTVYPPWVAPLIRALPPDEPSVVRVMRKHGIHPVRASHRIDALAASSEDARLLGIRRSSPLLRVRRTFADEHGRPIELGDDRYLAGAVGFGIEVEPRSERFLDS